MKGFEIKINDEPIISASSEGVITVAIDVDYAVICGSDKSDHLCWPYKELKKGDKMKILVTEINEISPIKDKKPLDRNDLKESYYRLKKELEEKGLI